MFCAGTHPTAEPEAADAIRMIRFSVVIPMHYRCPIGAHPQQSPSPMASDTAVFIL